MGGSVQSAPPTWVDEITSDIQFAIGDGIIKVFGGAIVERGYIQENSKGGYVSKETQDDIKLTPIIDGPETELIIAVRRLNNESNHEIYATMTWEEIS